MTVGLIQQEVEGEGLKPEPSKALGPIFNQERRLGSSIKRLDDMSIINDIDFILEQISSLCNDDTYKLSGDIIVSEACFWKRMLNTYPNYHVYLPTEGVLKKVQEIINDRRASGRYVLWVEGHIDVFEVSSDFTLIYSPLDLSGKPVSEVI